MIKRLSIIFVILLLVCALVCTFTYTFSTFYSIKKDADESLNTGIEYDKKSLTTYNYSNYIAINASMTDYQKHENKNVSLTGNTYITYSYSCTIKIETQKNRNVTFSNVVITFQSGHEVELDFDGNSTVSYLYTSDSDLNSKTLLSSAEEIKTIKGSVIIPEEENDDIFKKALDRLYGD